MKYVIMFLFVTISFNTYSQGLLQSLDPQAMNDGLIYMKKYTSIKGSPYLADDFFDSDVKLESGKVFKDEKVNIDLVGQEVLTEMDGSVRVLDNNLIKSFTHWGLNGTEEFRKFKMDGTTYFGKVIYEADDLTAIALTVKKVIRKVVDNTSYNDSNSNNDYFATEEYYVLLPTKGSPTEIEVSKKAYDEMEQSDLLKKYTKEKKLNLKDEADFVKLIQYYDSLN